MAVLKSDMLRAAVYNTILHIRYLHDVPEANAADIADVKQLLLKHHVSDRVRIKLAHRRFRLKDGEVFAAPDI